MALGVDMQKLERGTASRSVKDEVFGSIPAERRLEKASPGGLLVQSGLPHESLLLFCQELWTH